MSSFRRDLVSVRSSFSAEKKTLHAHLSDWKSGDDCTELANVLGEDLHHIEYSLSFHSAQRQNFINSIVNYFLSSRDWVCCSSDCSQLSLLINVRQTPTDIS